MAEMLDWSERRTRAFNRFHARAGIWGSKATGFTTTPEPLTIGTYAKGRQLVHGNYLFAGYLVEAPGVSIWDVTPPDSRFTAEIHGCAWLDDLAAAGDPQARELARTWVFDWIRRYDSGKGSGWVPELTGRRLIRWINHALFILRGASPEESATFFRAMARQHAFLVRRWRVAVEGMPRFEALTGLIYAGIALEGLDESVGSAAAALAKDCDRQVDATGGIPTRNPEELLDVFNLLLWARMALEQSGHPVPEALTGAIQRIVPTLRALRHSDGGLARFHGGGRGRPGQLDRALADARVKERPGNGLHMGYARMSAGRTSIIIDAAKLPEGRASVNANASTLAFELTSGRRPVVVNSGSGAPFGQKWWRAGRATPSQSTLGLDGISLAQLAPPQKIDGLMRELLQDGPKDVRAHLSQSPEGIRFEGGHDAYVQDFGLTHARILDLSFDGRAFSGEDLLAVLDRPAQRRFDDAIDETGLQGIPFSIRFHLHPDVDASLDMGGSAVSITLLSGEVWVFRHDSVGDLTIQPSAYLEKGRLKPRSAKQIVLSARALDYATRIRWSFAKAQDSEGAIRDLTPVLAEIAD